MKTMMKTITTMLLLFGAMFATPAAAQTSPESDFTVNSDGVLTAYNGPGGNVVIPQTVGGVTVRTIGDAVFMENYDHDTSHILNGVVIPEGVTAIGSHAFLYCYALANVSLPGSLTSIGYEAFGRCIDLSSIDIPDGVQSIGGYAFADCLTLSRLSIGAGLKTIGEGAFTCCTGLTSIDIPSGVTTIGLAAFEDCIGLTSVTIGSGVTTIGDFAFFGCIGLTSVTIPNGTDSIGQWAFSGCTGLTSVTIQSGVKTIGDWAFRACAALTSITIPGSVTLIGNYAFDSCTGLTEVHSLNPTPPALGTQVFGNPVSSITPYIPASAVLYVPVGAKAAYQAADQWQDFSRILEDATATQHVVTDNARATDSGNDVLLEGLTAGADYAVYSLTGALIARGIANATGDALIPSLASGTYILYHAARRSKFAHH